MRYKNWHFSFYKSELANKQIAMRLLKVAPLIAGVHLCKYFLILRLNTVDSVWKSEQSMVLRF